MKLHDLLPEFGHVGIDVLTQVWLAIRRLRRDVE
jgi:hypothetical protein